MRFLGAQDAYRMTFDQNHFPFRSKTGQYCFVAYWNEPETLTIETNMNISSGIPRLDRSLRPGVPESKEFPVLPDQESPRRRVPRTVRSTDSGQRFERLDATEYDVEQLYQSPEKALEFCQDKFPKSRFPAGIFQDLKVWFSFTKVIQLSEKQLMFHILKILYQGSLNKISSSKHLNSVYYII